MNRKAQALVEFILIIPVLIMIIFICIDIGNIFLTNNKLENITNEVIDLLKEDETIEYTKNNIKKNNDITNINLYSEDYGYLTISLEKEISLITPGLGLFIDNPYMANAKRVIRYE